MFLITSFFIGSVLAAIFALWALVKKFELPIRIALQGFRFPFGLLPYFVLAVFINILISVVIRDVDPPIGDSWRMKITDSVVLQAIDTTDDWYLAPVSYGEAISDSVQTIADNDVFTFGLLKSGSYFVFSKVTEDILVLDSLVLFNEYLRSHGVTEYKLTNASEYYFNSRVNGDVATILLLFLYPIFRLYRLVTRVRFQLSNA